MLRLAILLQLTIWVSQIHAFFPWPSPEGCVADPKSCGEASRRSEQPGEGVAFELTQRRGSDANEPIEVRIARAAEKASRKYGGSRTRARPDLAKRENKFAVASAASPAATNAVGIHQDGGDISYFISVGFGSANKPLYMLVDTGAGASWVMGNSCKSSACAIHTTFGPEDSKTFQAKTESFAISYGTGTVQGNLASDSLSFAGIKTTMTFGVANTTSDDFNRFAFDGIFGLSMAKGATDNFLKTLQAGKSLTSNIFGVSLNRNSDGPNTGEIMFGAANKDKYTGELSYNAVSSKANGDWAIPLDDISYDGKKAGITGRLAYIDTGTTYMFGPPQDVAAIHKQIPGAQSADGVTYTAPCNSKAVSVSFGGVSWTIPAKDWLSGSGEMCTSNILGHEVVPGSWLMGDIFLKNVYSVFDVDKSRIGFASKPAPPTPTSSASSASGTSSISAQSNSPVASPSGASSPSGVTPPLPGLSGHETAKVAPVETAPVQQPSSAETKYVSIVAIVAAFVLAI